MEVLILQVFVSLVLVVSSLMLFAYSMRRRDHEHADRLALLPIEEDTAASAAPAPRAPVLHGGVNPVSVDNQEPSK